MRHEFFRRPGTCRGVIYHALPRLSLAWGAMNCAPTRFLPWTAKSVRIAGLFLLMVVATVARAENIVFPADAGVINVRELGAKGDGVHDDTAILQKALADHPNEGRILYLP